MQRSFLLVLILFGTSHGDDIYLKNGYVHRNVVVTSSTGQTIRYIKSDSINAAVNRTDVLKIEYKSLEKNDRYAFEPFDAAQFEQQPLPPPTKEIQPAENERTKQKNPTDTVPLIPLRHNSIHVYAEWGKPVGMKISAGITVATILSVDFFVSNYDHWSKQPNVSKLGMSIAYSPNFSVLPWYPVQPFLQFSGGTQSIIFSSHHFYQAGIGLFIPLVKSTGFRVTHSLLRTSIDRQSRFLGPSMYSNTWLNGTNVGLEVYFSTDTEKNDSLLE